MLRNLNKGQRLNKQEIFEISNKYRLSLHAQQRYKERLYGVNLRRAIRNCILAYYNTDGTVNIAIDDYTYLVVAPENYKVITIKEKSYNDISIWDKQRLARQGKQRLN